MVTPINEWQPQIEEVTLPSGKVAKLKRPDLVDLIAGDGDIPDVLSGMVASLMGGNNARAELDLSSLSQDQLKQILQSMNLIAVACFVEPKLWHEPDADDTHIPVSWVQFNDRVHVMAWALGGRYEAAKSFPVASNGHVQAVSAEPELSPVSG